MPSGGIAGEAAEDLGRSVPEGSGGPATRQIKSASYLPLPENKMPRSAPEVASMRLSAVATALLTLAAASGAPGRPVHLSALRLHGGVAPPIVQLDSDAVVERSAEERQEEAARRQRKLRLSSYYRLRRGRIGVFGCLYLFALLNGLARRSLSSAAPSLVELGYLDKARLDQLFAMGSEAFALGKFLVAPVLLALGPRLAAMLQIGVLVLASSAFCVWPGNPRVQVTLVAAGRCQFLARAAGCLRPICERA